MELLEREAILASLAAEADSAASRGRTVLLTGEAGIGKSSVVRAFLESRPDLRHVVGFCDPVDAPRSLGPIRDIVTSLGIAQSWSAAEFSGAGTELLSALAAQPTIMVIEDAHWADDATLDALVYLARRVDTTQALIVVTYRSDELQSDHPLRTALGRIATTRPRRIQLEGLSVDAVRTLCHEAGVDLDPVQLRATTGGNPFFVSEVAASGLDVVPPSVVDSVLARAEVLTADGRQALEVASMLPRGVDLRMLRQFVASTDSIDECCEHGLLQPDGLSLVFRHELARRAIESSVPPARRRELHEAVLRQLAARSTQTPTDAAELAYHADLAGDLDATVTYAELAAQQAVAVGSLGSAIQHYRALVAALGHVPSLRRAVALEGLGNACWAKGESAEAIEAFAAAADLRDVLGQADVAIDDRIRMAVNTWWEGHGDQARRILDESVAELALHSDPSARRVLGVGYGHQARLLMLAREIPEAIYAAQRSIDLATEADDVATLAQAWNALGTSLWFADPDRAEPALIKSLDYARAIGDLYQVGGALINLGSGAGEIRRYETAIHYLDEAIALGETHDIDRDRDYGMAWKSRVLLERGDLAGAADLAGRVTTGPSATIVAAIVAQTVLATVRIRRGDPDPSTPLQAAWTAAVETGDLQRRWPTLAARAEALWWSGRALDPVVDDLLETYAAAAERQHPWAIGELGLWLSRAGRPQPTMDVMAVPFRLWIEGAPLRASDSWRTYGCRFEAAWALLDEGSEASLRTAFDEFDAMGAQAAARRCREGLRQLGAAAIPRGARSATMADPSGLTPREAEVLELLSGGLTNREIAERLVLSTRTVDHHVSAVLRKLDVATRDDAVVARRQA